MSMNPKSFTTTPLSLFATFSAPSWTGSTPFADSPITISMTDIPEWSGPTTFTEANVDLGNFGLSHLNSAGILPYFEQQETGSDTLGGELPDNLGIQGLPSIPFQGFIPRHRPSYAHHAGGGLTIAGGGTPALSGGMMLASSSGSSDDGGAGGSDGDGTDGNGDANAKRPFLKVVSISQAAGTDDPLARARRYLENQLDGSDPKALEALQEALEVLEFYETTEDEQPAEPRSSEIVSEARRIVAEDQRARWKKRSATISAHVEPQGTRIMRYIRELVAGESGRLVTPDEMVDVLRIAEEDLSDAVRGFHYRLQGPSGTRAMLSDWKPPSAEERPVIEEALAEARERHQRYYDEIEQLAEVYFTRMLEFGRVPLTTLAPQSLIRALYSRYEQIESAEMLEVLRAIWNHYNDLRPHYNPTAGMRRYNPRSIAFHISRLAGMVFAREGNRSSAIRHYNVALNEALSLPRGHWREGAARNIHFRDEVVATSDIEGVLEELSAIRRQRARAGSDDIGEGLNYELFSRASTAQINLTRYRKALSLFHRLDHFRTVTNNFLVELEAEVGGGELGEGRIAELLEFEMGAINSAGDVVSLNNDYANSLCGDYSIWMNSFLNRVSDIVGQTESIRIRLRRIDEEALQGIDPRHARVIREYLDGAEYTRYDEWHGLHEAVGAVYPYSRRHLDFDLDATLRWAIENNIKRAILEFLSTGESAIIHFYRGRLVHELSNPVVAAYHIGRHERDLTPEQLEMLIPKSKQTPEVEGALASRASENWVNHLFTSTHFDDTIPDSDVPEVILLDFLENTDDPDRALRAAAAFEERSTTALGKRAASKIHPKSHVKGAGNFSWSQFSDDLKMARTLYARVLKLNAENEEAIRGHDRASSLLMAIEAAIASIEE